VHEVQLREVPQQVGVAQRLPIVLEQRLGAVPG